MKSSHIISSGLSLIVLFCTGCPVASTQQTGNVTEPSVVPAVASSVDHFALPNQLEGREVASSTNIEPKTVTFVSGFTDIPSDSPLLPSGAQASPPDSPPVPPDVPESPFDSIPPNPTVPLPVFEPLVSDTPASSSDDRDIWPLPSEDVSPLSEDASLPSDEVSYTTEDIPQFVEETPRSVEAIPDSESSWTPPVSTSFADEPATTVSAEPESPKPLDGHVEAVGSHSLASEADTANPEPPSPTPQPLNPEPRTPNPTSYDPVKANGEYFVNWPKPKLLLVFTGFINGYVEPCGCAGIEQMKGGLSRRSTFLKELGQKGWPVIPIEAGNLNKGFGRQEEWKYNYVIDESLRQMKYEIVGLGNRELQFPTDVLILYCVDVPGSPCRYTSANIELLGAPNCITPFRTQTMNGVKVGVISVMGASPFENINNQDIRRLDIVESLTEVLPSFDEEKCDYRVLIVHGSDAEFKTVLKAFPNVFDFALCSSGPAEPPAEAQWIGNTMNVEVGEKGKYAIAIGLFDDADRPMRYQRVALDSRFKNSSDVTQAMQFYQAELGRSGLSGLGIKAIPNRRAAENGTYVGSKACADCHEPSQKVWQKSKHAQAWKSLAETAQPARTHDPECIACHVVGWSPTEFLPYASGFMGEKETPHLVDVGCESCHGPGERHVAAEKTADDVLKQKLRKAVRLPLEGNAARKLCIECHDGDNSPHFDFDTYWPKIHHQEE